MTIPKEVQHALKNDYPLIPMADITDEARVIAVAWMECSDRNFIREKQKLASDIMNYARRHSLKQNRELFETIRMMSEEFAKQIALKNEEIMLLKNKPA